MGAAHRLAHATAATLEDVAEPVDQGVVADVAPVLALRVIGENCSHYRGRLAPGVAVGVHGVVDEHHFGCPPVTRRVARVRQLRVCPPLPARDDAGHGGKARRLPDRVTAVGPGQGRTPGGGPRICTRIHRHHLQVGGRSAGGGRDARRDAVGRSGPQRPGTRTGVRLLVERRSLRRLVGQRPPAAPPVGLVQAHLHRQAYRCGVGLPGHADEAERLHPRGCELGRGAGTARDGVGDRDGEAGHAQSLVGAGESGRDRGARSRRRGRQGWRRSSRARRRRAGQQGEPHAHHEAEGDRAARRAGDCLAGRGCWHRHLYFHPHDHCYWSFPCD